MYETLADETGGRAFINDNSFNAAFAASASKSAATQQAAFTVE